MHLAIGRDGSVIDYGVPNWLHIGVWHMLEKSCQGSKEGTVWSLLRGLCFMLHLVYNVQRPGYSNGCSLENCPLWPLEQFTIGEGHEFLETCNSVTSHCTGQFTPKMKANAEPRLLSSLVWIDSGIVVWQHRLESFFMNYEVTEWQVSWNSCWPCNLILYVTTLSL